MTKKVLGRDLADLLTRARPARLVGKAAQANPASGAAVTHPRGMVPPVPLELPLAATEAKTELKADPAPPPSDPVPKAAPAAVPARAPASPVFATRQAFALAQSPPPGPPRLFFVLVALDVAFLAAATLLFFTNLVPSKYAGPAAFLAVLAGGACTTLAYFIRSSATPAASTSKVRVQIRRI